MRILWNVAAIAAVLVGTQAATAAVPAVLNFSGRLASEAGDFTGTANLAVAIWDDASLSDPSHRLWAQQQQVFVSAGRFHVLLGGDPANPLPDDLLSRPELYVGTTVDDDAEMTPRMRVASVPFALRAADAERVGGHEAADFAVAGHRHAFDEVDGEIAVAQLPGTVVLAPALTAGLATKAALAHHHDAAYVKRGEADAISGDMILDGTVLFSDLGANGCAAGDVVRFDGDRNAWACGQVTTYSGADFALADQSCQEAGGQVVGIDAAGALLCAADVPYTAGALLTLEGYRFALDQPALLAVLDPRYATPQDLAGWVDVFDSALDLKSDVGHGHGIADVAGLQAALDDKSETTHDHGLQYVTSVETGAGLAGGPIVGTGTISIAGGGVTNAMLANSSVTVSTGAGLQGGGVVALGASRTLSLTAPVAVNLGGTGQTAALNANGVVYAQGTSAMASTAAGASGSFLRAYGNGTPPSFAVLTPADVPALAYLKRDAADTSGATIASGPLVAFQQLATAAAASARTVMRLVDQVAVPGANDFLFQAQSPAGNNRFSIRSDGTVTAGPINATSLGATAVTATGTLAMPTAAGSITGGGIGSGLDADLLDGRHYADLVPMPQIPRNNLTTKLLEGLPLMNQPHDQTSITIGSDGLPVVAFSGYSFLRVLHCSGSTCATATWANVDVSEGCGYFASILLGIDGFPSVAYRSGSGKVKLAKCGNASCTSGNTIRDVDSTLAGVSLPYGTGNSLGLLPDGNPVIGYYDIPNKDLKVARCTAPDCSSGTLTTADVVGEVGLYPSLAVAPDGLPVIAYWDKTNGDAKVLKCGNAGCESGNTITAVDTAGWVGEYTALAIGGDGLPIVVYLNAGAPYEARVLKCGNAACTADNQFSTLASGGSPAWFSVAMAPDGLPVIAYQDRNNGNLHVARCSNHACSAAAVQNLGSASSEFPSVTVAPDGAPVISSHRGVHGFDYSLSVTKCANAFCAPFWNRR